jgi:putative glutamine amidotransferase
MRATRPAGPRIIITVAVATRQAEPGIARQKNELYAAAVSRHGAAPLLLDATASTAERAAAFHEMDGLLLSGGADLEPARYGRPNQGSTGVETERDALEAEAWAAAMDRARPVLGICRGVQAINVLSGGKLLQDVEGHAGPSWGHGSAMTHPLRVAPGTRLARVLFPNNARGGVIQVNSYHHQGIRGADLAPDLVANAWASSPAGDLIEGLEAADGRFIIGLQSHPERSESTPTAFERLFAVFVDAARGPLSRR